MRTKKRYSIAVLIGGVHTFFPQRVMAGILETGKELDVNICFFLGTQTKFFFQNMLGDDIGNVYDYQFNTIYDYSLLGGFDGIIINYGTLGVYLEQNDAASFAAKYAPLPTIILTETTELPNCYHLISNNYQGISDVMKHLIEEHGYKRILHVAGPNGNTDALERKEAYRDALKKYQLPFQEDMIEVGDYSEYVDKQVERLLDRYPDADAIVFANDEMALAGYRVCAARNLQVGRDIAIAGYDDSEIARTISPPLSTVSQDGFLLGHQAVQDLVDLLNGQTIHSRRIPVQFIPRESCGCPSAKMPEQSFSSLHADLAKLRQDSQEFQRKAWFPSYLSRDLHNYVHDEAEFYHQIMHDLQLIHNGNMFLFIHETPVSHCYGDEWVLPEHLHLACYQKDQEIHSYLPGERPMITRKQCMMEYMNDDSGKQYSVFLLFSEEKQYGLFACDIAIADFPFFYLISLQLGLSLRYLEMTRIEAAYIKEMSHSIEIIQEQNRMLGMISAYDELTGLLNLRGFIERTNKLKKAGSCHKAYMIYADLDHLKEINDAFGHVEGNFAIRSAAKILKKSLRDTDPLARNGGDEFVALVLSDSDTFEENFRHRVADACQTLNDTSGKPFYVQISLGVAEFVLEEHTDLQQIIATADESLYKHKKFRSKSVKREIL